MLDHMALGDMPIASTRRIVAGSPSPTFPDLFTGYERRIADQTYKACHLDAWETIYGAVLERRQPNVKTARLQAQPFG